MRPVAILLIGMALCGCAAHTPEDVSALPLDVGNGIGSAVGNYEMKPAGETTDAAGDRCVIYNWDRPLNREYAIRYSSMSCESKTHPIWNTTTDYARSVVPLAQSNLSSAQ